MSPSQHVGPGHEQTECKDSPFNSYTVTEDNRGAAGAIGHLVGWGGGSSLGIKPTFSSRKDGAKENSRSKKGFLEVETFEPGHKEKDIRGQSLGPRAAVSGPPDGGVFLSPPGPDSPGLEEGRAHTKCSIRPSWNTRPV